MSLLVTGGCGFIGSGFINHYASQNPDHVIVNIDAMYYCAKETNVNESIRTSPNYHIVKGNLCSNDLVAHVLVQYKITHVIHFAAQSHVQRSFDDSIQFTKDNILGTHTLLEECRKYGKIERFIHVSTDEVYGESMLEDSVKTETSILCPTNPYAATKAGAELIAQAYYHSYKMPIIITRGNNVYGPNQYPEKIIPKFIKQINEGKQITIQGSGENIRSFLHVEDVAKGFEIILNKGSDGEIYNLGADPTEEYTVLEIANKILNFTNCTEDRISFIEDRPFNDKRYFISNDKVKALGWKPIVVFDSGLKSLIQQTMSVDNDDTVEPSVCLRTGTGRGHTCNV